MVGQVKVYVAIISLKHLVTVDQSAVKNNRNLIIFVHSRCYKGGINKQILDDCILHSVRMYSSEFSYH